MSERRELTIGIVSERSELTIGTVSTAHRAHDRGRRHDAVGTTVPR